jgi:arylsulfatase A-like enzyme
MQGRFNKRNVTRRSFLRRFAAGAAGLIGAAAMEPIMTSFARAEGAAAPAPKGKCNFLFILADDLGWKDLGCQGSSFYDTPHLDRLAAGGTRFTNAYAACPVCSPTRASIMTGRYPARLHLTDFIGGGRNAKLITPKFLDHLPLEEVTIAEALKQAGYATFFAGKWHLGKQGYWPENQGFDVNMGGNDRGGPYGGNKYFSPYGNPTLPDGPPGEHLPARLAVETTKFIEAHKDGPFLAYLSFYSVHTPLMAREDLKKKYEQRRAERNLQDQFGDEGQRKVRLNQCHAVYGGMVEAMDQAVGHVLDALDRLKLAESTVVIFMSDNGGLSTSEGSPTSNVPLRAGKGWLYEGGIREPMIVRWPGQTKPGSTCDVPVISTDFYPTMLDMAGLAAMPQQHRDGVSIAPLLTPAGGKIAPRPLFWHYPHYGNQGGSPGGAVRVGDWKLIEFHEDNRVELYNLAEDTGEKNNLAAKMPEKAAEMRKTLDDWRKSVNAAMPTPNPNPGGGAKNKGGKKA